MTSDYPVKRRKKLIEVAIPLEAINAASAREKSIRHGHPSTLHLWWARRPLAAARAVIFCQMVDDPSAVPEEFPTEEEQEKERLRLFALISELVLWESTTREEVLEPAREEIRRSWRRCCADNAEHPEAAELFNSEKLPGFHDPFAGGGALPLEAQRLGLESYASDLNPVAVLINKAMIEIPPKFAGMPPVNPEARSKKQLIDQEWEGTDGLVADIEYYGEIMLEKARNRLRGYYPPKDIEKSGRSETIAWLWTRTVESPNPAFSGHMVPLLPTYYLSKRPGKVTYLKPVVDCKDYTFEIATGKPNEPAEVDKGTKEGRGANFRCILSGDIISAKYIKQQGLERRLGVKLIAKVVSSSAGRVYKIATQEEQESALSVPPSWSPTQSIYYDPRKGANTAVLYGLKEFGDIFTSRQKYALNGFADALAEIKEEVDGDCLNLGINSTGDELRYSDAVCLYLAFAISKIADRGSTICSWDSSRESIRSTFGRQALAMTWDFVESNPLSSSSGSFANAVEQICKALRQMPISATRKGCCIQSDAQSQSLSAGRVVSTDPPYYDNIGYSDLSDFFYVWLRRSLSLIGFSDLLRTVSAPKGEELVVQPTRHSSAEAAEMFFLQGMQTALSRASTLSHPAFPCTVYYAFKQSEDKDKEGAVITGWEVFLSSVLSAGLSIEGTWPLRTELGNRMVGAGANALASSMVLVCGLRNAGAKTISRAEFKRILRKELPASLRRLERSNTAPVDMAQAAIGPGMEIYSKYKAVLNSDDTPMVVKEALIEINKALDEHLNQEEGEFDADSRFALTLFETYGYEDRPYGDAEGLAVARNISVEGVARSGILAATAGRVCLLRREQLIEEWNPMSDQRICVWEATQYLIKRLEDGEAAAASLLAQLKAIKGHGDLPANCRALAYRLYNHCEKTKQAEEARAYNGLVIAWPELEKLSVLSASSVQPSLL